MRFLVTAGPTREFIDPVRFISNPSTGKMGFAIAEAARKFSPNVVLITGPTHLNPPRGVRLISVVSTQEMFTAMKRSAPSADIVIQSAAVSDYRPAHTFARKQKKTGKALRIDLVPNPDIAVWLGKHKRRCQVLVGFAAETNDLIKYARGKLERKNLDLIVANDVSAHGAGFAGDTNRVILLWRSGKIERLPRASKKQIAMWIVQRVVRYAKMAPEKNQAVV